MLLREGQIEQQGPPLDLFERPATQFVAGFLGSPKMNFLTGRFDRGADGACIDLGEGAPKLALPRARDPMADQVAGRGRYRARREQADDPATGAGAIEALRKSIPSQVLTHYDRLVAQGKKGLAVVRNGVCTQCHISVAIGALAGLAGSGFAAAASTGVANGIFATGLAGTLARSCGADCG